uniref:Fe2OG dioxygenase domain-containing protein n=1 Tax=Picea sitchensis TaxID=3332 RepID=A9NYW4_PICSI|nr:unknown [Picea sitchensis]
MEVSEIGLESKSQAFLNVDQAFILSPENRPNTKHSDFTRDRIPLIDLSILNSTTPPHPTSLASLVTQIHAACRDWGFFQVINHGVSLHLLHTLQSETARFFSLPMQEKTKVRRDFDHPLGYYDTELTKNIRDWKEVFDFACRGIIRLPSNLEIDSNETQTLTNQWPENPPRLREACEKYAEAVEKLSFILLELISLSLGLPAEYFNSKFEDHTSFLRLNHYPPCPVPELALGVGQHKDAGALTVLVQDEVGGLQVRRKDGEWIGVKPVPDSFVINVGDCIQVWSNDKYESVEHRVVVNDKKERFSIPFFLNPSHYAMVRPALELVNEENPIKYKEYNWGKFLKSRYESNFKHLGIENLQIHHFSISPNSS